MKSLNRIIYAILLSNLLTSCRAMMVPVNEADLRYRDTTIKTSSLYVETGPDWNSFYDSRKFVYEINIFSSSSDSNKHTVWLEDICFVNEKNGDTIPIKTIIYDATIDYRYKQDTLRQQLPASIIIGPGLYKQSSIRINILTDMRKMNLKRVKVSYQVRCDEENVTVDSVYLKRKYRGIIGFRHLSDLLFLPIYAPIALYIWIFGG